MATEPFTTAGYMLELDNVTIGGISGAFGVANLTGTITDSGSNSMTLYYWPTSYSVANANLFGQAIPTGPVNMTGFVSVYNSVAEFTPMTVTVVPEPGTAGPSWRRLRCRGSDVPPPQSKQVKWISLP